MARSSRSRFPTPRTATAHAPVEEVVQDADSNRFATGPPQRRRGARGRGSGAATSAPGQSGLEADRAPSASDGAEGNAAAPDCGPCRHVCCAYTREALLECSKRSCLRLRRSALCRRAAMKQRGLGLGHFTSRCHSCFSRSPLYEFASCIQPVCMPPLTYVLCSRTVRKPRYRRGSESMQTLHKVATKQSSFFKPEFHKHSYILLPTA